MLLGIGTALLLAKSSTLSAGQARDFPTFDEIDFFWTQNPQRFQSLWQAAKSQTVRVAILGDSQETNPGGAGVDYIPRLNYEMWARYGNVPETPLEGCSNYGGGAPYADWLLRGGCAAPGPSPTRLQSDQILPNLQPKAFSTLNGSGNVNGEYYGQLTMLQQDAIGVDPAAEIPTGVSYFNTQGVVRAQIFAATNSVSGEIAYWAQPTNENSPSYFAPVTTAGTLSLGLESPAFAVLSGMTLPLSYSGNRYMALQVAGTDDEKLTDILGLRFVNETFPQGVIFDTLSQGGYQVTSFLSLAGNAGATFKALDFQAVIIHYGANDSANGVTAQQFQTNTLTLMASLRSWVGDPTFPVILISDAYHSGLTAAQQSEFDKYVGAQVAIAQLDSNVMVINSRRLTDDIGWNATSGQFRTFVVDRVHYTPHGAQVLAAAEVAAMTDQIIVSACVSDPGSVTLPSSATLTVNLGGRTACSEYGRFGVAQTLTLSQPRLDVEVTNGYTPALRDTFRIIAAQSVNGEFGELDLPMLPAGLKWDTSSLYTTGTITVGPPAAPSIKITPSDQSVTEGGAAAPVAISLTGTGTLTVTAGSSNESLLPDSGISLGSGCGRTILTCTAKIAIAAGQSGNATIMLTVRDGYGQQSTASASIQVNPAPHEGGGAIDALTILVLGILLAGGRAWENLRLNRAWRQGD